MCWVDYSRVDRAIYWATAIFGLAMLLAPVWTLAFIDKLIWKLSVISAFTVLFTFLIGYVSDVKSAEYLVVATAGYAAVLKVFLQLGDP